MLKFVLLWAIVCFVVITLPNIRFIGIVPIAFITQSQTIHGHTFMDLLSKYKAHSYWSGHLHTAYNLVPNMVTPASEKLPSLLQPLQGTHMEMELGDWKDNRLFRIFSVDKGYVSYVTSSLRELRDKKPIILITNRSPLSLRLLIFSTLKISSIHLFPNEVLFSWKKHKTLPLYEITWESEYKDTCALELRVTVTDANNHSTVVSLPATNHSSSPSLLAKWLLLSNWSLYLWILFLCAYLSFITLSLSALREYLTFWLSYKTLFTIILLSPICPISIGEMTQGTLGISFQHLIVLFDEHLSVQKTPIMLLKSGIPMFVQVVFPFCLYLLWLRPHRVRSTSRLQLILFTCAMLYLLYRQVAYFRYVTVRIQGSIAWIFAPYHLWIPLLAAYIVLVLAKREWNGGTTPQKQKLA